MVRLLLMFLITEALFAEGSVSVSPKYNVDNEKVGYKINLSVYENIVDNWYINPFIEYENKVNDESQIYGKLDINNHINEKIKIGTGTAITKRDNKNDEYDIDIHLNFTYKLW